MLLDLEARDARPSNRERVNPGGSSIDWPIGSANRGRVNAVDHLSWKFEISIPGPRGLEACPAPNRVNQEGI